MGKSGKKAGKRLTKKELVDRLTAMFLANVGTVYSLKDISRELNLTTHPLKMLCADILNDMTQEGFLIEQPYGSFRFNSTSLVFAIAELVKWLICCKVKTSLRILCSHTYYFENIFLIAILMDCNLILLDSATLR